MKAANVFVLTDKNGQLLAPATQATVLAQYSRSPKSAHDLVEGVTPESAEAFQKKWGVDYGHSSIAELCTMPYCFEGVSIVASKVLERYQRAGYSEKSTRYQQFSEASFIAPDGAPQALLDAAALAYRTYRDLEQPVLNHVARLVGGAPVEDLVKKPSVKARAFDAIRYLLPAGTGTNLAAVVNARDARYIMSDLLGHELPELRAIGQQMVEAAGKFAPVFAMGAKPNDFEPKIRSLGAPTHQPGTWGVAVTNPMSAPMACAYEGAFWRNVQTWYDTTVYDFHALMDGRGKQQVPEVFKTVPITFDVQMDYGAFRDLQRHRRCEQFVEPLGPHLGFLIPDDLRGTDFEKPYVDAMTRIGDTCKELLTAGTPDHIVQYAVPLGYLHRSIFQMDLRELYYVVELRTAPQGHISYRRVAWEMLAMAMKVYPSLMQWCRATAPDRIEEHR